MNYEYKSFVLDGSQCESQEVEMDHREFNNQPSNEKFVPHYS